MYIPLRGCCTDGASCDELPIPRQIFLTILSAFGSVGLLAYALTRFHA